MLYNCTQHMIRIKVGEVIQHYPPCGLVLRVETITEDAGTVEGIPVVLMERKAITVAPKSTMQEPPADATHLIVSSFVASNFDAAEYEADHGVTLLAPDTGPTAVRNEENQIEYVLGLQTFC